MLHVAALQRCMFYVLCFIVVVVAVLDDGLINFPMRAVAGCLQIQQSNVL